MAIDRDAILAAAEQLHAETGRLPTVEDVRAALGGGSFSTITPVLRAWKAEQKAAQVSAPAIPERVRSGLERATAALWAAFREEMDERIEQVRQEAARRAEDAEGERDQALGEVTRLEQALVHAERQATETEAGLRAELEQAQATRAAAGEEIARLAERTDQQQARLEQLGGELAHAHEASREQAAHYEATLKQAQDRAAALERKLEDERADHARAATVAAEQMDTVRQELAGARTECARQQAALESARESLQEARQQAGEARAGEQAAREQITALQAENARLQARVENGGGKGANG